MVLSERVAWPEYMEMVRAALVKQAEAIIKQGAALETGSSGGRGGGAAGKEAAARNGGSPGGSDLPRSRGLSGAAAEEAAAGREASAGNEPTPAITPRSPSDCQAAIKAPAGELRRLTLGKTLREATGAGPESWAWFCFDLPAAGPILTVVLDIADGDPDIVVSRGRLPCAEFGLKGSAAAAVAAGAKAAMPTAGPAPLTSGMGGERRDSAAAAGVPGLPGGVGGGGGDGGGEWRASSTHRDLRVVKIFPRDPG